MRRDFDLIRLILIDVEEWNADQPLGTDAISHDGFTPDQVVYHAKLLIDGGYIEGEALTGEMGRPVHAVLLGLTMKGHDFLDDARDSTVWNKTKADVVKKAATVSLSVLQEMLKATMRTHLNLPM